MDVKCTSKYEEGYSAYCMGIKENPYEQDTPANYAWREGWLDAEHDAYIDSRDYFESLYD